jgi:hypothetical protein
LPYYVVTWSCIIRKSYLSKAYQHSLYYEFPIMLFIFLLRALAIQLAKGRTLPEVLPHATNNHARDLQKRATVDCGTWTMYCGGTPKSDGTRLTSIEDACDNACHFIKVTVGGDYTATYRPGVDDTTTNRRNSGCWVGGSNDHSICTFMPFSQKYV